MTIRHLLIAMLTTVLSACGTISYDPSKVPTSTWNTSAGASLMYALGVRQPSTKAVVVNNLGDRDIVVVNQYTNPDTEIVVPPGQDVEISFIGFGYQYREEFALTVRVRDNCGMVRTDTGIFRANARGGEVNVWEVNRLPRGSCRLHRRRR